MLKSPFQLESVMASYSFIVISHLDHILVKENVSMIVDIKYLIWLSLLQAKFILLPLVMRNVVLVCMCSF